MATLEFRAATREDLPAIVDLLADDDLGSTREDTSQPLNPAYVDAFAALDDDPNQLLAVAVVDGHIVGCLQLSFIPGLSRLGAWRGQIESVRVAADVRAAGHGRALIEWAIEECRRRGCRLVQLTSDKSRTDALRFYEALDFVPSHEGLKLVID